MKKLEQIEVREGLLAFGAKYFAFQFDIKNFQHLGIQNYNLAYFLYGCETWSLKLREERRLRAIKNGVLWRIFGPKRDEVTGEWRRLHNEELNDLYSSQTIIWVIESKE
jgi:hypothetical protein